MFNYRLYSLDDFDTGNPVVRDVLRTTCGYWLATAGVDADRTETAVCVRQNFFSDFLYSADSTAPVGKPNLRAFGEGFATDLPYDDINSEKTEAYTSDASGNDILPAMLNYPLYGTIGDVLHEGHPTAELGYRIQDMMAVFERPSLMPTFLDNHDVDRFLAAGSIAGLRQGLVLVMTLPGVPVVHYGMQQAFTEQRGAMFTGGDASGGHDKLHTPAAVYRFIAQLTHLRKQNKVFSHGNPAILDENSNGPGAFAYTMTYGSSTAIVAINTSDTQSLTRTFATGLAAGARLANRLAVGSTAAPLIVATDRTVTATLPSRSAFIWMTVGDSE